MPHIVRISISAGFVASCLYLGLGWLGGSNWRDSLPNAATMGASAALCAGPLAGWFVALSKQRRLVPAVLVALLALSLTPAMFLFLMARDFSDFVEALPGYPIWLLISAPFAVPVTLGFAFCWYRRFRVHHAA